MSMRTMASRRWSRVLAVALAVAVASPLMISGVGLAAQGPPQPPGMLDGLTIEHGSTPDRLESSLAQLALVRAEEGASAAREFGEMRSLDITADTVEVLITTDPDRSLGLQRRLQAIGVASTGSYGELVRAEIPIDKLLWLSGQPEVLYVRPPVRPTLYPVIGDEGAESGFGEASVRLTAPAGVAGTVGPAAVGGTVLDDGFESWPGPWTVYGSPTWGPTTYRASTGSYSAYCVQSSWPAPGPHPDNTDAWLVAGPFDFSGVTGGTLSFDYWLNTEDIWDELFVGFSDDGSEFWGEYASGDSGGWQLGTQDIGDYAGSPAVWIAFAFRSDDSVNDEGVYIDAVTLTTSTSTLYTSEGVAETNADVTQAGGVDGTGIKIGIIDGGFAGYEDKLGTELPASVTCWGGSDLGAEGNGSVVHGTAVAETVHDMAPGADLYLAQFSDVVDLAAAADWMVSQGVDVINMSAGWSGTNPGDGTGPANDIVADTVADGVFWANSAGNSRERHWAGDFVDAGANGYLDWDTGFEVQAFAALAGQPIEGVLCWDDDWSAPTQDYDLGLLHWNGSAWEQVIWSENVQNGTPGQEPIEVISGTLMSAGTYGWAVAKSSATRTDVDFDFFDSWRDLQFPVYARSICSPADNAAAGFMAVGAVGRSPDFLQESYSSEGPTRDDRVAPEIAGPSNTSNSVYEYFAGTSSSSPHVAGAAALVLQANPTYTPAQTEAHLKADAIDIGVPGVDTQTGYGRLWVDVGSVPPDNQAPEAVDDDYSTIVNEPLSVPAPGVLGNDWDPDGDTLSAVLDSDVSFGNLDLYSDGSFDYTPYTGYIGEDSFTYRASDGELESYVATVYIMVGYGNETNLTVVETVDFGNVEVGSTLTRTITVTNEGTEPLYIGSIAMFGWDTAEYKILNDAVSDHTLAVGEEAQFDVRFTPTTAATGPPSFTRWSFGYMAQYLYDGMSLSAIDMNTYPGNVGGSGNCSYSVTASGRTVNRTTYVYGGDHYALSTVIPLYAWAGNEFLYTSSIPGGFADSITFDGYVCTGDPSPELVRLADARVEFFGTDPDPDAYLARVSLFGVGVPAGSGDLTDCIPIAGIDRYQTAILTSKAAFAADTADCVIIATGQNWPDALGGAALAAAKNGPILLTAPAALSAGVIDEIRRLGASEAVILGGIGAVSYDVELALIAELGEGNVSRLGGLTRYETAEMIAAAAIAELEAGPGYDGTAFVSTGANFPDALAGSPLAAAKGWPIFLSHPTDGPPIVEMQARGVTKALILGGSGVVSYVHEGMLESAFPGQVERLAGADRYATGVVIAQYGVDHAGLAWDGFALATGSNFPDALAGGVLAGRNGSVMLLTSPTALPAIVASTLTANRDNISTMYYLGGTGAISQDVRDSVELLLR